MKPDWKDAPEWARYLAKDKDGYWNWFETKPVPNVSNSCWYERGFSMWATAGIENDNSWKESLEQRQ